MKIQERLRRAAASLAAKQFDAALSEVEAALALDPGSLPALALRERIDRARDQMKLAARPPASAPGQFVPTGVDAQSWLGFEQRVQERRFRALLESINAAIAARDGITARLKLEEARELRPDAPELADIGARIAPLPAAIPPAASASFLWSRAIGAIAMLLVGVSLLIGLDSVRSPRPEVATSSPAARSDSATGAVAADVQADAAGSFAAAIPPLVEAIVPPASTSTVAPPESPEPAAVTPVPARITTSPAPARVVRDAAPLRAPEPDSASTDVPRTASAPAPAVAAPNRSSFPAAGGVSTRFPPDGEVPDDYVAPSVRRPAIVSQPPAVAAAPTPAAPLGTVTRGTTPGTTTAPGTPATSPAARTAAAPREPASAASAPAATPAAAVVTPAADTSRVALVLDQYARRYAQLDASAVREVWPTVNERALARAFAGLQSQDVSFDNCDIDVRGETANASCTGRTSYVGKVGSREQRTESRQWNFELRRDGDAWKIQSAEARRPSFR